LVRPKTRAPDKEAGGDGLKQQEVRANETLKKRRELEVSGRRSEKPETLVLKDGGRKREP